MNTEIKKLFRQVIINSLSTQQVNYLGEKIDASFDVNRESGYGRSMEVPRQTAAETLLHYFNSDHEVVSLFTYLLQHEDERFYNRKLLIWGKEEFLGLLGKHKWIYDDELIRFFPDPFYEHEINFLKKIRIIDLRTEIPVDEIIKGITELSEKMSLRDLEWRITLRLYDLDPKIAELIRKILGLLLVRQRLKKSVTELFVCLKELAINASKANYKILFEKYHTSEQGITTENNYYQFLELFRDEIGMNGNDRLIELARKEDRYINISFQSTLKSINIWVTNNQNISLVEKKQILRKLEEGGFDNNTLSQIEEDLVEGAGLGLSIILSVLHKYSNDPNPLKAIFYPNHIKIGFELKREDLMAKAEESEEGVS